MTVDCPFCAALANRTGISEGIVNRGRAIAPIDRDGAETAEVRDLDLVTLGLVTVLDDGFPLSPGHRLVIPVRHVARLTDLSPEELAELWHLVGVEVRHADWQGAAGVNVGVNDGSAAGQTVPHVHVHVIPRHWGDTVDPRGGVRWVIPEKARYWTGSTRDADGTAPQTQQILPST